MSEDRIEGTAKKGFGHVQDAVGGLIGDNGTQAKGKLNQAAGSVQDAYGKVLDQAQDAVGQAKDVAQDVYGEIEQFVSDQPYLAVAAGVGVGLVLGLLLSGGRKTVYVRK